VVSEDGANPIISAVDARHDQVYYQVVSGNGSSLIRPRVAPVAEALEAARLGAPLLVGNAAGILGERWPADAPQPVRIDAQPAPDIAWVAWLGAAVDPNTAPARPYYLRAPDAKPQTDRLHASSRQPQR
jgi:tRNA threonylcarbamoyladenosine biosynthesis protein TsaB